MRSNSLYRLLIIGILSILVNGSYAQRLVEINSFELNGNSFDVDGLGYVYVKQNEELTKYGPLGDSLFQYSNKLLGEIEKVDLTLSMRPLLFYRNSNQIIVTDNTLSEQIDQSISLEELNWQQVTHVSASFNNNKLWLYDNANFEIIQVNRQLEIEQRSGNLLQIIGLDSIHPSHFFEFQNNLYINDPKSGLLVFDVFGTYYNTIHVYGMEAIALHKNFILYTKEDLLKGYDRMSTSEFELELPIKGADQIQLKKNLVYILKNNQLHTYKIVFD